MPFLDYLFEHYTWMRFFSDMPSSFLFFFQALDDCLKHHLGDDVITSINELTSQVKIRGIYKDEVVTMLKRLGY